VRLPLLFGLVQTRSPVLLVTLFSTMSLYIMATCDIVTDDPHYVPCKAHPLVAAVGQA